jgi:putative transposase
VPFWRLHYHLVWATKDREPLIQAEIEGRLYSYLVRKAAELGVYVYAINGCSDHIHLIVAIPPKHAVADVVKGLKGASSHYLNQSAGLAHEFAWQGGYGALSLGEGQRPSAVAYVQMQKTHHEQQTINGWLERDTELDEGPPDTGIGREALPLGVHEAPALYDLWGKAPFQENINKEEDTP